MYDNNVVSGQLSQDESEQLCHLHTTRERLQLEIQEIREEILNVTQRISELQSEVEKNSDMRRPEIREAVDLFNDGKFKDCFEQLLNSNVIVAHDDSKGKASFLSSNIHHISKEMFHKYLFKSENQAVMQSFIHAIPFEGLSLLDTVRKCFRELSFVEAEADIITRIYKYTSESYYNQNREEAEKHFDTLDACEFAAGAIVFINTTINNPNVKEKDKMTEEKFAEIGTSGYYTLFRSRVLPLNSCNSLYQESENFFRFFSNFPFWPTGKVPDAYKTQKFSFISSKTMIFLFSWKYTNFNF